jgi:hypothetical protein
LLAVRKQREHILMRWALPSLKIVVFWMLGFHLRRVFFWEKLTLLPLMGFLPQIEHLAMTFASF